MIVYINALAEINRGQQVFLASRAAVFEKNYWIVYIIYLQLEYTVNYQYKRNKLLFSTKRI